MNFFLKARAWEVFMVIVVLPFILQSSLLAFLFSSIEKNSELTFRIISMIVLVIMAIYLFWFWCLGVGLNKYVPEEIRPKVKLFKFGITYSTVYTIFISVLIIFFGTSRGGSGYIVVIYFFHLVAVYFMYYALYFISKNLVTSEQQKTVKFSSFSGPFFLLWFFPIGIWFIQPRINKMYSANSS